MPATRSASVDGGRDLHLTMEREQTKMRRTSVDPPRPSPRLLRMARHICALPMASCSAVVVAPAAADAGARSTKMSAAVVPGTSFIPQRTSDPKVALDLLQRDGGVVFRAVPEGVSLSEREQRRVAAELPARIFGDRLAQFKMPARLAGGGWDGKRWQGWQGVATVDRGHIPNKPHMDGGGDLKPDYFLMYSGECATTGPDTYRGSGGDGGSILLDGYGILDSMPQRDDFFTVDTQSRNYSQTSGWRRPMAQWTNRGRLMLSVPVDGHTDNGVTHGQTRDVEQPVPGCPMGAELIRAYKQAVVRADLVAPRFAVREGEAVLIDNVSVKPTPVSGRVSGSFDLKIL